MKFFAASVPRSVRAARLAHLRTDAIIGTRHIQNPGGASQVFDVVMQAEADFLRTKNHLATQAVSPLLQQGQMNAPYVLKDTKQFEVSDDDPNAAAVAALHFRKEFKVV